MATERSTTLNTRLVVVFDMCSSSDIIEGLTLRGEVHRLERFLTEVKRHLRTKAKELGFEVYKFTGDGWILLFPVDMQGRALISFLRGLCAMFHESLRKGLLRYLDETPHVTGVTFGLERGPLLTTTMFGQKEYIGRALNVACRLQTAIKDKDANPAYKALVSNTVYNDYCRGITDIKATAATRTLRNIRGGATFKCYKLQLLGSAT